MSWAQDERIKWIHDRLANGERINRADLVEKFIITRQTATATMNLFRKRHPGAVVYDGKTKAFWAPGSAPSAVDWRARTETGNGRIGELEAALKDITELLAGSRRGYGYVIATVLPLDMALERALWLLSRTKEG